MMDRELVAHSGCAISVNPTGSGLHGHNEKEKSNLALMHRCLYFQVSKWSPKRKWKSRGEGGGELLLRERFFSACVSLNCICVSLLQLHSLQSQLEFQEQSMVEKSLVCRQEAKIREVETKLEYERTQIKRLEVRSFLCV